MAEKATRIKRLDVAEEATFAVDPSATGAAGYSLNVTAEMTRDPAQEILPRNGQTDDLTSQSSVPGAKGGGATWKQEIKGHTTRAGAAVAAQAPEADLILKHAFGTVVRMTGSTVVSATNNTVTVTGGHGAQFTYGGMIEVNGQRRFLTLVNVDTLTVHADWTTNPTGGQIVYASSVYKPANTGHKSLSIATQIGGLIYTHSGCVPDSLQIDGGAANAYAMLAAAYKAATWVEGGKASLPATSAATQWGQPPVLKGSPAWWGSTQIPISEFAVNFGFMFEHHLTTEGTEGKGGFTKTNRRATGSFKPFYVKAHHDDFVAGTERQLAIIAGGAPATVTSPSGWGFFAAKAQFTGYAEEDRNGVLGENIPFQVNNNGANPDFVLCVF